MSQTNIADRRAVCSQLCLSCDGHQSLPRNDHDIRRIRFHGYIQPLLDQCLFGGELENYRSELSFRNEDHHFGTNLKEVMFSLRKKEPEIDEVERRVGRIINQSTPNVTDTYSDPRTGNRYNRSIPVLLVPWYEAIPAKDEAFFAMTKDLSSRGLSITTDRVCDWPKYVVGLHYPDKHPGDAEYRPFFVEAHSRSASPLGGGFWHVGIEFQRILTKANIIDPLQPLADHLFPPQAIEEALEE